MHYIQQFWNHLRNTDGEDIFLTTMFGFVSIMVLFFIGGIVWALIEWLGVFVVMVPIVIIVSLLLAYAVGRIVVRKMDML